MSDELSLCYSGSSLKIGKGDLVLFDGQPGEIKEIISPESELSKQYSCFETGGLLLLLNNNILMLIPLGHSHIISLQGHSEPHEPNQ